MLILLKLTAELIFLACVTFSIPLVLLAFRNEHRPRMLKKGWVEAAAANGIAIGIVFSLGFLITGLTQTGMNPLFAIIIATTLLFVFAAVVWKLFGVRERLRRADAGQSPFYLPDWMTGSRPGGSKPTLGNGAAI
ncbi:MAG: hypothetical protein VX871_07440 [Pseudomonadota bacterium]|nr:hypothetical protein [Pseudomonadota bacterium]